MMRMKQILKPRKLKYGAHIRVIAPARSMALISGERRTLAIGKLAELGLEVSFGKNIEIRDEFLSSPVSARLDDLHDAFADTTVDGILTVIGGYNSNQLLDGIDYDLIARNPKILCGYSDISTLSNAIFARTGLIGYLGPHFSTFSMLKGFDYTLSSFRHCLMEDPTWIEVKSSDTWSDDEWYLDQNNRQFETNDGGYWLLNQGSGAATGCIIGGHLRCLHALQGTPYMPDMSQALLFLEEDEEIGVQVFDRMLQSLLQQPAARNIQGIVIGRFQKKSEMTREKLEKVISTKTALNGKVVIANADFGHTSPIFTFPVGGQGKIEVKNSKIKLFIET